MLDFAVINFFVCVFCRSLDLTGPLLLGGVPNLPEDFPVRNRDFVGCMRNLSIDSKAIDMDSYIANNGTTAGMTLYLIKPKPCSFSPTANMQVLLISKLPYGVSGPLGALFCSL